MEPAPAEPGNWRDNASCRDADPDLFFPIGTTGPALRQTEEAIRICQTCPMQAQCLAWALEQGVADGVWGGTTPDQRRAIRRLTRTMAIIQEGDDDGGNHPAERREHALRAAVAQPEATGVRRDAGTGRDAGGPGAQGSDPDGGFAREFATADGKRVRVAALTPRQFADLTRATRLATTFGFLERLLPADFSTHGDLYAHRATIAKLLAPWFARRTVADLSAAFAGTSVAWAHLHARAAGTQSGALYPRRQTGGCPPSCFAGPR